MRGFRFVFGFDLPHDEEDVTMWFESSGKGIRMKNDANILRKFVKIVKILLKLRAKFSVFIEL